MKIDYTNSLNSDSILELLDKFPSPGKRFNLFPTPSKWSLKNIPVSDWIQELKNKTTSDLYIHIPFCKSLCTFCGCNVKVTQNHEHENIYVDNLLKEWKYYNKNLPHLKIKNLFLGGGTPNSLSLSSMEKLLGELNFENLYLEADPRYLSKEQAKLLKKYHVKGYNFGIQDIDHKVLVNVNRAQNLEQINQAVYLARMYGYCEVAFDFIYGLSFQTPESLEKSLTQLCQLAPDLVNFYPLAHVPWQEARQKAYGHVPNFSIQEKNILFETGLKTLEEQGMEHIGFNCFIHRDSPVYKSFSTKQLKRSLVHTGINLDKTLIGLGVSSISFTENMYVQNEKIFDKYIHFNKNEKKVFPNGHTKSETEIVLQNLLDELFTNGSITLHNINEHISSLGKEGLLDLRDNQVSLTPKGRHFLSQIFEAIASTFQ